MDKETRNELRKAVTNCRKLLEDSLADELEGQYGIYRTGKWDETSKLTHLSGDEVHFREGLITHIEHIKSGDFKPKDAVEQLTREVAFTHLNRMCAYKMMEARGLIKESVTRGLQSNGFKHYLADHDSEEKLWQSGEQYSAYKHYLDWLGGTLSEEIGVLFSPLDPANKLFPNQKVFNQLLDEINKTALNEIWDSDETIGWIYQYFTPKELRDTARKESAAPRNSYELAFRNQFFTPRYVVEFLTDNTLARTWYEMREGKTNLKKKCSYLVIRPNEIFLKPGKIAPEEKEKKDLSKEELLKKPAYFLHREKKDPREMKILDPACGSGHFLLYCFDLLEEIYIEAYDDPDLGEALKKDYSDLDTLKRAIPGLIIGRNLYGVDIDRRATQIASLALWLRAQRSYAQNGLKPENRPKIRRSNFVVAEPMPGNRQMLRDFIDGIQPPIIGRLVEYIFEKMKLAGEAGTLLKIEKEMEKSVDEAKLSWMNRPRNVQMTIFGETVPSSRQMRLDFKGISSESFWDEAENLVLDALKKYSEKASSQDKLARQLFAEDAAQGFAFIDLCKQKFDVVLMNPPFGDASKPSKEYIDNVYPRTKNDIFAAFIERGIEQLHPRGKLGAITSRTGFFLSSFQKWREEILLKEAPPTVVADLGYGVLDTAMVEVAAYCLEKQ